MFATCLEQVLLPALAPRQVVVVDDVGAHGPDRMRPGQVRRLPADPAVGLLTGPVSVEDAFSSIKILVQAAALGQRWTPPSPQ